MSPFLSQKWSVFPPHREHLVSNLSKIVKRALSTADWGGPSPLKAVHTATLPQTTFKIFSVCHLVRSVQNEGLEDKDEWKLLKFIWCVIFPYLSHLFPISLPLSPSPLHSTRSPSHCPFQSLFLLILSLFLLVSFLSQQCFNFYFPLLYALSQLSKSFGLYPSNFASV